MPILILSHIFYSLIGKGIYKDGKFIDSNLSMQEKIKVIVLVLVKAIGQEEARKEMTTLLPTLKRWKTKVKRRSRI